VSFLNLDQSNIMPQITKNLRLILITVSMFSWSCAAAEQVTFSDSWNEQTFSLFSSNEFELNGDTLEISSDGTVSILWKILPSVMWGANQAHWNWVVKASVPPTDLTLKGGDDRNLSIYFLFLPEEYASKTTGRLSELLRNEHARVLMYVWGGRHNPGEILPSPYLGELGKSLILQRAGTGTASEQVNLAIDFQKAFGDNQSKLLGIAISADSDDTNSTILATISDFHIYE
jgi:hypothetical protein